MQLWRRKGIAMSRWIDNITVACAQFDIKLGNKAYNISKMKELAQTAKEKHRADLIIYPECSATGYSFHSLDDAKKYAETVPGELTYQMTAFASKLNISILFGMLEMKDDFFYNVAVFCEPNGKVSSYRKSHLPHLGIDRFLQKGTELNIIDSRFGPLGIMVCYDLRFPEVARQMALKGARILLQPTNLPKGGEAHADILTRARACENRVYLVSCNRSGLENGNRFIGRSQIVDINGDILAEMGDDEGLLCATLDLKRAEDKDIIVVPNEYETYLFKDRRPELYDALL
jgi:predicted amidohydrolase